MCRKEFYRQLELFGPSWTNPHIKVGGSGWILLPNTDHPQQGVIISIYGDDPTSEDPSERYAQALRKRAEIVVSGKHYYWPTIDIVCLHDGCGSL